MKANKLALSLAAASALLISFTGCGSDSNDKNTDPVVEEVLTPGVTGTGREEVYTALVANNADTTRNNFV